MFSIEKFKEKFEQELSKCEWMPHKDYSVFTQYDKSYYLKSSEAFLKKYRTFYLVSKILKPKSIMELGCCAGSSGDAFLSAVPEAQYLGIDIFGKGLGEDGKMWDSYEIIQKLFKDRKYKNVSFYKENLRKIVKLPIRSEFVFVDAMHDERNAYLDMILALTAYPKWIFCDDTVGQAGVAAKNFAIDHELRIDGIIDFDYVGQGKLFIMGKI